MSDGEAVSDAHIEQFEVEYLTLVTLPEPHIETVGRALIDGEWRPLTLVGGPIQ